MDAPVAERERRALPTLSRLVLARYTASVLLFAIPMAPFPGGTLDMAWYVATLVAAWRLRRRRAWARLWIVWVSAQELTLILLPIGLITAQSAKYGINSVPLHTRPLAALLACFGLVDGLAFFWLNVADVRAHFPAPSPSVRWGVPAVTIVYWAGQIVFAKPPIHP